MLSTRLKVEESANWAHRRLEVGLHHFREVRERRSHQVLALWRAREGGDSFRPQ